MRAACAVSVLAAAASLARPVAACPPTAMLRGPAVETRQLEGLLLEQGVAVNGAACPHRTVAATLARLPGARGLRLHIQDAYGRASERQVADTRTAASLIGSWVLGVDADFIAAPAFPPAPSPPPAVAAARAAEPPSPERTRLLGGAEVAAGSDGSLWYGAAVGACRVRGAWCLGGRARLSVDSGLAAGQDSDTVSRTAVDLALIAARPLALGLVTITPLGGIGGGLTRTYDPPVGGDATGTRLDLRPQVEGAVTATVALARRWAIVGEVGASLAAPVDRRQADGDGGSLPAPPAFRVHAGLGCQYAP